MDGCGPRSPRRPHRAGQGRRPHADAPATWTGSPRSPGPGPGAGAVRRGAGRETSLDPVPALQGRAVDEPPPARGGEVAAAGAYAPPRGRARMPPRAGAPASLPAPSALPARGATTSIARRVRGQPVHHRSGREDSGRPLHPGCERAGPGQVGVPGAVPAFLLAKLQVLGRWRPPGPERDRSGEALLARGAARSTPGLDLRARLRPTGWKSGHLPVAPCIPGPHGAENETARPAALRLLPRPARIHGSPRR